MIWFGFKKLTVGVCSVDEKNSESQAKNSHFSGDESEKVKTNCAEDENTL